MNAADIAVEICIASAEEGPALFGIRAGFLSRNGFPFVMIHNAPELAGERRKVVFEDAKTRPQVRQRMADGPPAACGAWVGKGLPQARVTLFALSRNRPR
jgi:hypothetical protein